MTPPAATPPRTQAVRPTPADLPGDR
jgi:hypothetical protein